MERLTTNKPVAEMGMYELAHNSCYMDGERKARYRDFEQDIDARELARHLFEIHAGYEFAPDDDEAFDEEIMEALMYGSDSIDGLIALFYRNLWAMADLYEKLKRYEEMEEQGLLLKLPCKIGDDVYIIPSKVNYDLNVVTRHKENNRVYHQKIKNIVFTENGWYMTADKDAEYGVGRIFLDIFFGETWFLTKAEAEKALAEMEK